MDNVLAGQRVKLLHDKPFLDGPKAGATGTAVEDGSVPFIAWDDWSDGTNHPHNNHYAVSADDLEGLGAFVRETRYYVIKINELTDFQRSELGRVLSEAMISQCAGVVVEADWPEYVAVYAMLEARASAEASNG